jgi:hypothetical protein
LQQHTRFFHSTDSLLCGQTRGVLLSEKGGIAFATLFHESIPVTFTAKSELGRFI